MLSYFGIKKQARIYCNDIAEESKINNKNTLVDQCISENLDNLNGLITLSITLKRLEKEGIHIDFLKESKDNLAKKLNTLKVILDNEKYNKISDKILSDSSDIIRYFDYLIKNSCKVTIKRYEDKEYLYFSKSDDPLCDIKLKDLLTYEKNYRNIIRSLKNLEKDRNELKIFLLTR